MTEDGSGNFRWVLGMVCQDGGCLSCHLGEEFHQGDVAKEVCKGEGLDRDSMVLEPRERHVLVCVDNVDNPCTSKVVNGGL